MKAKKILGRIAVILLALILAILLVLFVGVTVRYWDYYGNSKGSFIIPGLNSGYVPQSFDYMEEQDAYLMCGYMSDGSASRIYVRDGNGKTHYVSLANSDGTVYDKHAGGICHNGDYVYLAGDNGVDVFSLSDVLAGEDPVLLGTIVTGHDMAYCSFYNGYLLAGNFYYPEHYETPESHRITTPAGDENTALITIYQAEEGAQFGLDPTPVAAISTPGKVQGMCFTSDEELVLSISWSLTDSNLQFYAVDTQRCGTIELPTGEVPLYYLDSANRTKTVILPPMSEELVYRDGRVYVMCESACNKYIYGKLIRGWQVFAYDCEA